MQLNWITLVSSNRSLDCPPDHACPQGLMAEDLTTSPQFHKQISSTQQDEFQVRPHFLSLRASTICIVMEVMSSMTTNWQDAWVLAQLHES